MKETSIIMQRSSTGGQPDTYGLGDSPMKDINFLRKSDSPLKKSTITLSSNQSPKRHSGGVFNHWQPEQRQEPNLNSSLYSSSELNTSKTMEAKSPSWPQGGIFTHKQLGD